MIDNGKAGLSNDRKIMADAFYTGIFLWTSLMNIYPRLDLWIAPPSLVANYLSVSAAYQNVDESMSCYENPEGFSSLTSLKLTLQVLIFQISWFANKKNHVRLFYERKQAQKQ